MKRFTIHTISGEQRTVEAERYEINQQTGCIDFFDEQSKQLRNPIFFVYGLEWIEEKPLEIERTENSVWAASG